MNMLQRICKTSLFTTIFSNSNRSKINSTSLENKTLSKFTNPLVN